MTVTSAGCSAGLSTPPPALHPALAPVAAKAPPATAASFVSRFSALVLQNGPAVVNISSIPKEQVANPESLWPPNASEHEPFLQFFRQFSPGPFPDTGATPRNVGSGFIVRPDGYILTDARLVADAKEIKVKLTDRREFKASIVGVDQSSGVALLKIDANGLPTVKVGKPSDMKSGQWVVAIGAPYGFENTATAGIISNTARLLPQETFIPLIQTDMTATTGDDGAPLFNLNGEVIGITLVARSPEGPFEGISFAIPINVAMQIEQQLLHNGRAEHGHLGVTIQDVTWPLAQSFGLKKPVGALISKTDHNGPAARSGLRSGDIILQLNGADISDSSQLPVAVAQLRPGTSAHIQYWRDHGPHEAVVVLGTTRGTTLATGPGATTPGRLGLLVGRLTSDEKQRADVSGGVRVEQSAGLAALAGILPGDIVLQVNHAPVSDPAQFRQRMSGARNTVALLVLHDGQQRFVPLDLG
jgi:serine protease Do